MTSETDGTRHPVTIRRVTDEVQATRYFRPRDILGDFTDQTPAMAATRTSRFVRDDQELSYGCIMAAWSLDLHDSCEPIHSVIDLRFHA
jgi:hypothetical protein